MTTVRILSRGAAALGLTLASLATPLAAQRTAPAPAALDRTVQPAAGRTPELRVPAWERTRISNGAEIIITQKRDLPLVAFSVNFVGGAANFESPDKLGVASMTAAMLLEGTTSMTGEQLADAMQMLGTQIGTGIGSESGTITFTALKDRFEPALALLADMLMAPSFPEDALERLRARRLVALTQAKDQPGAIAANVFSKVLYGDQHPYGSVITEETISAITRDDIVAFHRAYFRPGRAVITVTGDVQPGAARAAVERAFVRWQTGGDRPSFQYPPAPAPRPTTIYLVDKPGSAQSVFAIGHPGPARDTPDYFAITVMNHILGGLFQSRLNHNIREVKGWSYGVRSSFAHGRGPGPFQAGGGIMTAKTDSALIEFMQELRGVQGGEPFTEDEITQGKESLIQSLPRRFGSVNGIGGAVATLYVQGLPERYYQEFASRIDAVTSEDLVRVARQHIDLERLNIVIVGDRAAIESPLRATGIAPVVLLDLGGRPVPTP
ncbi:MAG TPA: pitrilysin family protein [Gemmatimonadaceae bacterium]|nr:pitrilysin family protein [Gemmatimonadaceae bacterium]